MKVALSFFGQPRFIDNDVCYLSHKKFIMDNYDTDVFAHYWFDETLENFHIQKEHNFHNYVCKESPKIIEEYYNPIVKMEEKPKPREIFDDFAGDIKPQISHLDWFNEDHYYHNLSHLYSTEMSLKLVSDYMEKTGVEYDFVISTRMDAKIINFPNLHHIERGKIYSVGRYPPKSFVDAILIFDTKLINFKPYTNFKESVKIAEMFHPDVLKKRAYQISYNDHELLNLTNHYNFEVSLIRGREDRNGQI